MNNAVGRRAATGADVAGCSARVRSRLEVLVKPRRPSATAYESTALRFPTQKSDRLARPEARCGPVRLMTNPPRLGLVGEGLAGFPVRPRGA
jgi:hypothetical protein